MGQGTANTGISVVLALVAATVLLFALGMALRKRGMLRSRGASLGWAILTLLPLFGSGFFLWSKHQVEKTTGETQKGVNELPPRQQGNTP
ncbi:hypothetical protein [Sphingomonas xinjiangensis]|uniref:Uncharacterized protein n=1 Tax=Sphingomonas xinjiangensis TaxID=643568 RepID=A0A840YHE6_9SPHN|nr:hypothetical protein [Sphingomonas xinjiangensis]MBB5711419.1 hypothetical protein [Sphingomonas xinjiangensis]